MVFATTEEVFGTDMRPPKHLFGLNFLRFSPNAAAFFLL